MGNKKSVCLARRPTEFTYRLNPPGQPYPHAKTSYGKGVCEDLRASMYPDVTSEGEDADSEGAEGEEDPVKVRNSTV